MTIILNGQPREIVESTSVRALLLEMNLSPERVAVEVNRRLRRTERYDEALQPGDEVEVVTFVGGG